MEKSVIRADDRSITFVSMLRTAALVALPALQEAAAHLTALKIGEAFILWMKRMVCGGT